MPGKIGPGGKYDPECVKALVDTGAEAVVLVVLGGREGSGFAVNSKSAEIVAKLPALLRELADQIEGAN